MPTSPSRYVLDSSVLIDLHVGQVLPVFLLGLPAEFLVPDVILAELRSPDGDTLLNLGVQRAEFGSDEVLEVIGLARVHRTVSIPDLFALLLARREQAVLLTGDGNLRRLCKRCQVPAHGTLWILDTMLGAALIAPRDAARALRAMLDHGSRLPEKECRRRLREWEQQDEG